MQFGCIIDEYVSAMMLWIDTYDINHVTSVCLYDYRLIGYAVCLFSHVFRGSLITVLELF